MPIPIQCPNPECKKSLSLPEEHAGKAVKCPACGKTLKVPEGITKYGEFKIVRQIGKGGMGTVYEGLQVSLQRRVALKVLDPNFSSNARYLGRFVREARAAAAIQHPNIIQVFDIGEDNGRHFFAMEFVEGENAFEKLKRDGAFSVRAGLEIAGQIAKALQAAGKQSIIHRDIKPDNIMLGREGQVKLADLGLAKNVEDQTTVTQSGAAIGTPHYIAPEQAKDAANVDHRADIYALGVTLLHLLTGKRPFDGDKPWDIVEKHVNQPLPKGADLGVELPDAVDRLIQKMAAKEPDNRFQDYESLLTAIETAQNDKEEKLPEKVIQQPKLKPRRDTPRKKKIPIALYAGLTTAIAVVIGITVMVFDSGGPQPHRMVGYKKIEKTVASTTTIPKPPSAGQVPLKTTFATFKEVNDYVKENPDAYGEIIGMYRKISDSIDNVNDKMRADALINSWKRKWEEAAAEALNGTQNNLKAHLAASQFGMAQTALNDFPVALLHQGVVEEIEKLRLQIEAAKDAFIAELKSRGKPILEKEPGDLSREDISTLNWVLKRTQSGELGLSFLQAKEVRDFSKQVSSAVSRYRAHEDRRIALKSQFWDSYRRLITSKQFEQARTTVQEAEPLEAEEKSLLIRHTSLIEKSLEPAARNMPLEKALYQFHFGEERDSIPEFELASKSGQDVRLYLHLLGADLPEWMSGAFEIPEESEDSHGNPIRKGVDKKSGLPFEIRNRSSGIHFMLLPAGQFMMGSPETEQDRHSDEGPLHPVGITRPFYMGKYEVTGADWEKANGAKWAYARGEDFPLTEIRKLTAMMFASQLSRQLAGGRLRLPTEAEWEYACRAGSITPLHYGTDPEYAMTADYGWFKENSGGKVRPAGMKKPNDWGLYDMIGNVWEYVLDNYDVYPTEPETDPYYPPIGTIPRTIRGGGVLSDAGQLRSAERSRSRFGASDESNGFRLMLEQPRKEHQVPGMPNPVFKNLFKAREQKSWVRSGDGFFNWGSGLGWTDGGPGGIVYTAKKYQNFILRFDCLASDLLKSDAGIFYPMNGQDLTRDKTEHTFKIELSGPRTGSISHKDETLQSTELPLQPGWNSIELVVWERDVYTTREGVALTHWQRPSAKEGLLAIEGVAQQFCLRNFRILELQQKPAEFMKSLNDKAAAL